MDEFSDAIAACIADGFDGGIDVVSVAPSPTDAAEAGIFQQLSLRVQAFHVQPDFRPLNGSDFSNDVLWLQAASEVAEKRAQLCQVIEGYSGSENRFPASRVDMHNSGRLTRNRNSAYGKFVPVEC